MMKKVITFIIFSLLFMNLSNAYALDNNLNDYINVINEINEQYDANICIVEEDDYDNSEFVNLYKDYDTYINHILSTNIEDFRDECLQLATVDTFYTTLINHNTRSSYGSKTVSFNAGNNLMTLKYKYSGSKYDTSYKPTATVAKKSNTNYFVMSSYTGSFKNSNTRYTVVASGKLYGGAVVTSKTFTVNFDL